MAFHHTACFVFTVMVVCNAILYPSIFSNIYKQWFGAAESSGGGGESVGGDGPMYPPHMRHHGPRSPPNRGPMGGERAAAQMASQSTTKDGGGKSRGMMSSVLPVYAIGIVVYFAYIMYRIFFKDQGEKDPITGQPLRGAPCTNPTPSDVYAKTMASRKRREYEEELQASLQKELKPDRYKEKADNRPVPPQYEPQEPDDENEIVSLQKRLEETEKAMEKMMDYMNKMGVAMSQVTEQMATNEQSAEPAVRPKQRKPRKVVDDSIYYEDHDVDDEYAEEYYDDDDDDEFEEVIVRRTPKKIPVRKRVVPTKNPPLKYRADVPRGRKSRGPPRRKVVYVEEVEDDSDVDEDIYANDVEDDDEEVTETRKMGKDENHVLDDDTGAHEIDDEDGDVGDEVLIPENGIEDVVVSENVRKRRVKGEDED